MMQRLSISTSRRTELIDITGKIARMIEESGVRQGVCILFVPHTSAGVTLNEHADPDVARDLEDWMGRVAPQKANWRHVEFGEENADAHIKASIAGASQAIPIDEGRLQLGTWQGIFFCEFDGPRRRDLIVQVLREE